MSTPALPRLLLYTLAAALPPAAACSAEPAATDAADLDTLTSAAAACDAIAIPCCGRDEALAECLPATATEPERWRCAEGLLGTAAYGAACRAANPSSCPAPHTLSAALDGQPCPAAAAGDVCWYAKTDPGPDRLVCTCLDQRWSCRAPAAPAEACALPADAPRPATAPLPAASLAPTAACADPATAPRDASCVPGQQDDGRFCATHADCGAPGVLCLDSHTWGAGSACTCTSSACLSSADCPEGTLCQCGSIDPAQRCGGWTGLPCGHRCVPADCRSDADCAPGGRCAASYDVCGWQVERYACRYPDRDGCWTDDECGLGAQCRYSPAAASWCCAAVPVCD